MTPYSRVEQREKGDSAVFLSSVGCMSFVSPEEMGGMGPVKKKNVVQL